MTATATAPAPVPGGAVHADLGAARLSTAGIIRSEWVKLITLRSTWWCLGIIAFINVSFSTLISWPLSSQSTDLGPMSADVTYYNWMMATTMPIGFSVLVAVVLGCLVITGEYGTGMIRSSLTAAPGRISTLFAKSLVIGLAVFGVVFVSTAIGAGLSAAVLAGAGWDIDPGDSRVWLTLLAAAGFPALAAMFSTGVGAILKNSAGAIAAVLGLLLVVPTILQLVGVLLNADWAIDIGMFLPTALGGAMYTPTLDLGGMGGGFDMPGTVSLEAWQATLAMVAWAAAALAGGAALIKRRDV